MTPPPNVFGNYRLDELLGQGGMGEVFRAWDTARERTVAVKRLHPRYAGDPEIEDRFRREARVTAKLSSPHVIPVHDYGAIDNQLFIDMRLVDGPDLSRVLATDGPLHPVRAAGVVRQLAHALDAAHERGLIHRDIKPSNALIADQRGDDFVYLVDFGVARAVHPTDHPSSWTRTGIVLGTPAYMAPELFHGATPTASVDIYALGCLLYEAVTGRTPIVAIGPSGGQRHPASAPLPASRINARVPAALDEVLAIALDPDPSRRFTTSGDLAQAALEATGVRTGHGLGDGADGQASHQPTRHRALTSDATPGRRAPRLPRPTRHLRALTTGAPAVEEAPEGSETGSGTRSPGIVGVHQPGLADFENASAGPLAGPVAALSCPDGPSVRMSSQPASTASRPVLAWTAFLAFLCVNPAVKFTRCGQQGCSDHGLALLTASILILIVATVLGVLCRRWYGRPHRIVSVTSACALLIGLTLSALGAYLG